MAAGDFLGTIGTAIRHDNDLVAERQTPQALRKLRFLIMYANKGRYPDHAKMLQVPDIRASELRRHPEGSPPR